MTHPHRKNFNVLVSFLLGGGGTGLILDAGRFGASSSIPAGIPAALGFFCFAAALALQMDCVWRFSKSQRTATQLSALAGLFLLATLYANGGQSIGGAAAAVAGTAQFVFILLQSNNRFEQMDFTRLTISLMTFAAGILLAISGFELAAPGAAPYEPFLAAALLVAAFIAGATVIVPPVVHKWFLDLLQIVPWAGLGLSFLVTGSDNLAAPVAVVAMLAIEKSIPWDRLNIQKTDILSRRVMATAFLVETAHLIFLGSLLFPADSGLGMAIRPAPPGREAVALFFPLFSAAVYFITATVIMTSNGLIQELNGMRDLQMEESPSAQKSRRRGDALERYIRPFIMTPEGIRGRIQADQISALTRQFAIEKKRNAQLTLLLELSQQIESQFDPPVSAQLAVNTLERALQCGLAALFIHEPEKGEFMLLAAAGRQTGLIPTGYKQPANAGIVGRALRQRKTQIVANVHADPDYVFLPGEDFKSSFVTPLIFNGHVHGVILLNDEKENGFGSLEIGLAETVAAELTRAWERSGYQQRLTELIQTGSQLSSALDPETAAQEIAATARQILQAKFVYLYVHLGQERNYIQKAVSGAAPILLRSLEDSGVAFKLLELASNASQPFRIRDVRKYDKTSVLTLDHASLRSLLVIPVHWHQVAIGAIFAFGKQNEVFFSENDQSLAGLISAQAGGAFESVWLQQELRANLRITSLLYRLSNQIIQSESVEEAVANIARTTHKLGKNLATGIVLFSPEGQIIADFKIDGAGARARAEHPLSLIREAMDSGQLIGLEREPSILRTCLPIQTPLRKYGAVWMDIPDNPARPAVNPNDLQALVNQTAIALERSLLLVESRRQAKEIKSAYDTLETTYDQTLASLTSALDARDRETEGHSVRVTHLALKLGQSLGYSQEQLKTLERGALLHDIGKIGVSDTILHKPGALTETEWIAMRKHPDIGANIVAGIPFLEDTIPLIKHHQERWNGTGYPAGLKGEEIPELARLFAVVDAFDALTSNRPYRKSISREEALAYLREMSGVYFDPSMVARFETLLEAEPELLLPGD